MVLVVGALLCRRALRRSTDRVRRRGGDADAFARTWNRPWINVALAVVATGGLTMIILGLASGS
jgi:hypothetical protein